MRFANYFTLFGAVFFAQCALSADITVSLSGDSFNGPPEFEVLLDDTIIGQGAVETSPAKESKSFTFSVADELLKSSKFLSVRLTNDLYQTGAGDRNLRIVGATVLGVSLTVSDFKLMRNGEQQRRADGLLARNTDVAVALVAPYLGDGSLANGGSLCEGNVAVTGYRSGSIALTINQQSKLQELLSSAGKACSASITGYSSADGPAEWNRKLSEARAQAVSNYLAQKGIPFEKQAVFGAGGTVQFGNTLADNRRVVVELRE